MNLHIPSNLDSCCSFEKSFGTSYKYCQSNAQNCNAAIDQYIKSALQVAKQRNMPIDKEAIRLLLRPTAYINRAQASLTGEGTTIEVRPFADGLVVLAVLDTPTATRPLLERDIKKLGFTQDQIFELGSHNLQANLKPLAEKAKPVESGKIGKITGDIYEVSRLALHSSWEPFVKEQNGNLLVALPTTDLVLYISDDTLTAIDALRTLSKNIAAKSPNPLAPMLVFKWNIDGWVNVN